MMKKLLSLLFCAMLMFSLAHAEETPQAERLPDSILMTYYDQSLFVGDSLVVMFRNYVRGAQKKDPAYFSGIKFYGAYSYQLRAVPVIQFVQFLDFFFPPDHFPIPLIALTGCEEDYLHFTVALNYNRK